MRGLRASPLPGWPLHEIGETLGVPLEHQVELHYNVELARGPRGRRQRVDASLAGADGMTENDFDRTARLWLEDGPIVLSDRALLAALDEIHVTRQHRSARPVRRFVAMNSYAKLAIAAVVVVVVAIGGFALLRPGESSGPGGAPTATPSPTPSPSAAPSPSPAASPSPISTTDWVPFTSERYGYQISYPPTLPGCPDAERPDGRGQASATRSGRMCGSGQGCAPRLDRLGPDGSQIAFFAFAETIPAGTSVDDIISQSVGTKDPNGVPLPACESEPITIDGQPGRFDVCGDAISMAVVTIGDRAYVFIQGWGSITKDLMLAELSTVRSRRPKTWSRGWPRSPPSPADVVVG
jgi:hypothetical protein